jgi:hypothetical protein
MIVPMIDGFTNFTARPLVFGLILIFLVSVTVAQDALARNTRIPACGGLPKDHALIGWGKYGLFFSVPKHAVKLLGGKPDVDYVKFVIKPNKHEAALVLWFGPMAFHPDPPAETTRSSDTFTQSKLLNPDGEEIGLDSKGTKRDKGSWRWFGVWTEGGEYENASPGDAALFDRILDSACLIPYPKH